MPSSRRTFLAGGAAAGVGLAVAGGLPSLAQASPVRPHPPVKPGNVPFPPLVDDPKGILALPKGFSYTIVTRTGVTRLDRGQGVTPSDHDGMAVYDAGHGRYTLIQNHEIDPACRVRRAARQGDGLRRGRRQRRRLHRDQDRPGGPATCGEWVGISGTISNCAGGADPLGHLAHLRGDRGPRRRQRGRPAARPASTRRTTATSSRCSGPTAAPTRSRSRPRAATRTRPWPSTRTAPGSTSPRTPSGPNGLFYRWTAPHGVELGPGVATRLGDRTPASSRRCRSSWTTAGAPGRRLPDLRPAGPAVPGAAGSRCPTATRAPRRCASSSPTARSPAARSSRACGPPTRASTSSTSSPSARGRPAGGRAPSTTAWSGSTTTRTRPSRW